MIHAILAAIFSATGAQAAELNTSILTFGWSDLRECPARIEKARELGNTRLSFLTTIYYKDGPSTHLPASFCFQRQWPGCEDVTPELISQFRQLLTACFKKAADLGLEVTVLPHLDPFESSTWRNTVAFDPLHRYGGSSYDEAFIQPQLQALLEALPPESHPALNLAGEMGSSVFTYPASYRQMLEGARQVFEGRNLDLGISVNHSSAGGALNTHYTPKQLDETQFLLDEIDFLGISAYTAQRSKDLGARSFERNIDSVMGELAHWGLSLPASKPLHFSELGLGGGVPNGSIAPDAEAAANAPYAGVAGPYEADERNPWRRPALADLRRRYYHSLLDYLHDSDEVAQAFIWNTGSWDLQGLYPGTAACSDPELVRDIREHNLAESGR